MGVGKWIAGRDSLQREKLGERPTRGGREERGGSGGDESCGTFFTADKNICWDINLEP